MSEKLDLKLLDNAKKIEVNYDEELLKQIETLKQKNKKLKEQNKILSHNRTNVVLTGNKIMKRNLELQQENQELKEKLTLGNSLSRSFIYNSKALVLTTLENYKDIITEIKKLKKAIELLKEKFVIKFEFIPQYNYVRVCIQDSVDEISFVISLDTHKEQYDLLKEVLGND